MCVVVGGVLLFLSLSLCMCSRTNHSAGRTVATDVDQCPVLAAAADTAADAQLRHETRPAWYVLCTAIAKATVAGTCTRTSPATYAATRESQPTRRSLQFLLLLFRFASGKCEY